MIDLEYTLTKSQFFDEIYTRGPFNNQNGMLEQNEQVTRLNHQRLQ